MGTVQEKKALVRFIQENLVHLFKSQAIYGGQFDLDGIICISGQREGQELVVKLHERFGSNPNTPTKYPARKHDIDSENNNRLYDLYKAGHHAAQQSLFTSSHVPSNHHPLNDIEPEMLDLRMNSHTKNGCGSGGSRNDDISASSLSKQYDASSGAYTSPAAKRWKADGTLSSYESMSKSHEQGHDLDRSYSTNTSPSVDEQVENLSMSAANSEDGSSVTSTDKGQYLGKSPYLASPYHLQKKTPLKQERWTPSTPLPTVPECRQCGFTFESFEVLSEHNEAVHSVFTCQHCHKTFTSRSNLERHSRLHTGFKPYVCAICNKAFSRKDHLSNHSAKHAFKCGNCNKRYADKQSLATHFNYEHEAILTNTCEYCNKGFSSLEACEEHVKTHPQYQAVQKTYNHKMSDSPAPPMKKYNCESCKFVAPDRITAIKHRLVHVDGQRCYTCLSCAKMFTDPLQYDEHMLSHDGQVNIYECVICRQIFPTIEVLQRHEVVHLNEELGGEMMNLSLPCPHCDKVLRSVPALQEHIMQHATGLAANNKKQYKCLYCNMGFSNYADLCRHMDELRHYPPDPRMLIAGLGVPQHFPGSHAFDARKFTDIFNHKNAARELMLNNDRYQNKEKNNTSNADQAQRENDKSNGTPMNIDEHDQQKSNGTAKTNGEKLNTANEKARDVNNEKDTKMDEIQQEANAENDFGSDIEVVEPEAPEDDVTTMSENTEGFKPDLEGSEDKNTESENEKKKDKDDSTSAIQNQPVKSMLCNKNSNNSVEVDTVKEEEKTDAPVSNIPIPQPVAIDSTLTNGFDNSGSTIGKNDRARKRKGPSPEKYVDDGEPVDMSMSEYYEQYEMESLASENSNSAQMLYDNLPPQHNTYPSHLQGLLNSSILASENKLQSQIRSERKREVSRITPNKMSVDIPAGPCTCSICQTVLANFQTLEQHCFAEHNRCPCMFCPKTFAQKANRDRHVCLHTGDKPYECPECNERFSRGDKLKLHRVRTHNIPTHTTGYGSSNGNKRDSLTPGKDWVIPSPSMSHNEVADTWGLVKREENTSLVPTGGEWMVQENLPY